MARGVHFAELGDNRARFATAEGLQAYAGTAPVTFQSGQVERHLIRRARQPFLRAAVHLWADRSRLTCAWADDYYRAHRARGQSHACALRCLGQRWLKILWKMWQTSTPYDQARHLANQRKHGSPFLTALTQKPPEPHALLDFHNSFKIVLPN